jgi:ATP-dependent DNA helicase RecQ
VSDLQNTLSRFFGFSAFRPGQEVAIRSLLAGEHTLVVMPTGAGKSLIYQLAALCLPEPAVTLVISPLIALMKDQVDSLNRYGIPATYINSTLPAGEQSRRLQAIASGTYRLVYVAPERLRSVPFQQALRQIAVGLFVVDEAHCISHWGHDFRPDYRRIAQARAEMGQPLTVALTATATTLVQDDIAALLTIPDARRIVTGFNRPNLSFEVLYASDVASKQQLLAGLLHELAQPQTTGTAIVYVGTRREAVEVAAFVSEVVGINASYYHAGLPAGQRSAIQDNFLMGELPVVVATNAFGMGIDRPDVRLVVHYNLPGTLEAYYQEAGRAGRDGLPARAVLLYSPQDRLLQQWFIERGMTSFDELQSLYRALGRMEGTAVQTTLEQLAGTTRLDPLKARVGLAHLERAELIRQTGNEGAQMHLTLAPWDATAVTAITTALDEYTRHRQSQLDQMTDYAEADACRRHILLRYFSDDGPADAERCCDNCLVAQAPTPAPRDLNTLPRSERAALIILDTVRRLPWNVGRRRISDILKASRAKGMTEVYQQQTYYGRFAEFSRKAIEEMIEQLITQGYLKIVGGDIPVVTLTQRGRQALQARAPIALELPGTSGNAETSGGKRKRYAQSHTADETEVLLRQGMSPADIAAERELTERTIFQHLAFLVGEGRIDLAAVVAETVVTQVRAVADEVGDLSRLKPLKERLPDEISYEELRCVVEDLKRQRG